MRNFTIISFTQVAVGSILEFDQLLPFESKRIVGIGAFSSKFHDQEFEAVNLKLSLTSNNQRVFNGNPVILLGAPGELHKENPSWVEINQEILDGKNYITGYVEILTNPLGEAFDLDLIIKTE